MATIYPVFYLKKKDENISKLIEKTLDYIIFKHFNLWSEDKINDDQLIIRNKIRDIYFSMAKNFL